MNGCRIVILGLSITSSWGNGHATTYRGLFRELGRRGYDLLFLERDVPWYAGHRDQPAPPGGCTLLYSSLRELQDRYASEIRNADLVIVGSYVPQGKEVANWVLDNARGITAFYDIDTPVTLSGLASGVCEYLSAELIPRFDLYLSFTGGPTLLRLESEFGARRARPLYCSVDLESYFPTADTLQWDLGYLGTYSPDRQPALAKLLLDPALCWPEGNFIVAGAQFPRGLVWPLNVERLEHLPPHRHRDFYNRQRFTLNITRTDMIEAGWSPSVRLFEAAACGVPIISDWWPGLDTFFEPGRDILIAHNTEDVQLYLREYPEMERREIGRQGYRRVQREHTAAHRALQLESYFVECRENHPFPMPEREGGMACHSSLQP